MLLIIPSSLGLLMPVWTLVCLLIMKSFFSPQSPLIEVGDFVICYIVIVISTLQLILRALMIYIL